MSKRFYYSILPLCLMCMDIPSLKAKAGTFDEDALSYESTNKKLEELDLVYPPDDGDIDDDAEYNHWLSDSTINEEEQDSYGFGGRRISSETSTIALSEEQIQENERKYQQKQEFQRIKKIEDDTYSKILEFIDKHPKDLRFIRKKHKENKNKDNYYLSNLAADIGDHFASFNRYEDADYFYKLSETGNNDYTQHHGQGSQALMFLNLYNQEIQIKRLITPTSSLFYSLRRALSAFALASYNCEVSELTYPVLKRTRDMIVRWYIYSACLKNNQDNRVQQVFSSIYRKGFVSWILQQVRPLKIFSRSSYDENFAEYLKSSGFCGVYQSDFHHIWVNPEGIQIRIKSRSDNGKSRYITEFTVGFTLDNPIVWDQNKNPVGLTFAPGNSSQSYAIFEELNEIIKIAKENDMFLMVYAFRKGTFWLNRQEHMDRLLGMAHFPLNYGKFKICEKLLTSFNLSTGRVVSKTKANPDPVPTQKRIIPGLATLLSSQKKNGKCNQQQKSQVVPYQKSVPLKKEKT